MKSRIFKVNGGSKSFRIGLSGFIFVVGFALFPDVMHDSVSARNDISAKNIFTFNCETIEQKPSEFFTACADGNTGLTKITWKIWTAVSANGFGYYFSNDCNPDCADGHFHYKKVAILLGKPIKIKNRIFLTKVTFQEINSKGNRVSAGANGSWDALAQYREMQGPKLN
jgi:hypothetical protein